MRLVLAAEDPHGLIEVNDGVALVEAIDAYYSVVGALRAVLALLVDRLGLLRVQFHLQTS
jgi:hypothetical protein